MVYILSFPCFLPGLQTDSTPRCRRPSALSLSLVANIGRRQYKPIRARRVLSAVRPSLTPFAQNLSRHRGLRWWRGEIEFSEVIWKIPDSSQPWPGSGETPLLLLLGRCETCGDRAVVRLPSAYRNAEVMMILVLRAKPSVRISIPANLIRAPCSRSMLLETKTGDCRTHEQ